MKKMLAILLIGGLAAPVYGADFWKDKAPLLMAQQQQQKQQQPQQPRQPQQQQPKPQQKSTIQRTIDNMKKNRDQRHPVNPKAPGGVRG